MSDESTGPGHGVDPKGSDTPESAVAEANPITGRSVSMRGRPGRFLSNAFTWQGWKAVGVVATSLVAISTAFVAVATFFVAARTLEANTRQQNSDRFVKAIEQLGSGQTDVRLGGIYSLEQLARDSHPDQPAVVDVLTAFVRDHAPKGAGKCVDAKRTPEYPADAPNADVQAAVEAIGRRDPTYDRTDQVPNLSNACLVAAQLMTLKLRGPMLLDGTDLRGANLDEVDLRQASLVDTNLAGAILTCADLTEAILAHVDLTEAFLSHAILTRADLREATLAGAELHDATLTGADLRGADVSNIEYDRSTKWPDGFKPPPTREGRSQPWPC